MQYSEVEQKLIRLAMDKAAHNGEIDNSAAMLIKMLRKRGVTPEQIISSSSSSSFTDDGYYWRYRQEENAKRGLANQLSTANLKIAELTAEIAKLRMSGYSAESPKPKKTRSRTKYGYRALSDMERELLLIMARRAGPESLGRTLRNAAGGLKTGFGTMQRLVAKGYAEKRYSSRGWHGLTEKGIEYYKQYLANNP